MLYMLDLLLVFVLAPFARLPRRVAVRWLLFPLWSVGRPREERAEEAAALVDLLEAHRAALPEDGGEKGVGQAAAYFGPIGRVFVRVVPPLMALILFGMVAIASVLMAAAIPVALLWRSRRYLADATAVQLTRNPTALYRALARMGEARATVAGGDRASHLFMVAPDASGQAREAGGFLRQYEGLMGMHPAVRRRLARLVRAGAVPTAAVS